MTPGGLHAVDGSPIVEGYVNELEGFPGVACTDGDNPHNYPAWSIAGALADAQYGYSGPCGPGPQAHARSGAASTATATSARSTTSPPTPVLVVGNRFDPTTRYESAQLADTLLPRSELLTIENWGRTSLFRSACADAVIARYLIDVAAATTTCSQTPCHSPPTRRRWGCDARNAATPGREVLLFDDMETSIARVDTDRSLACKAAPTPLRRATGSQNGVGMRRVLSSAGL